MNPNLFKSTEFYKRRYHNFATVLTIPLTLLIIFLVLFSLFATKEVTVTSVGQITPTNIVASIQSTVKVNNLTENQTVKKGELLISYTETLEASQKQAIETQLERYKHQKEGLETLKTSLKQGNNLFGDNDEFGYGNIYNNFVNQVNDINLGISKANTEVSNQTAIASNVATAIDNQISKLQAQIKDYNDLYNAISNNSSSLPEGNSYQDMFNSYLNQYKANQDTSITSQYLTQIGSNISSLESSISNLEIQKAGTGSPSVYDGSATTKIEVLRT